MNKILEITNLEKTYQDIKGEVKTLNKINLDINEGEFVSIVGPSGCGKSTILSIIAKIDKNYKGNINYSKDINIGYMLQNDCLLNYLTILDNSLLGLKIKGLLNKKSKDYVISLLKNYGLEEFINKYPPSLSGGMRQRVA